MSSESKQVGEPGLTPPIENLETPTATTTDNGKGKALEAHDEKEKKPSAAELQQKLKALFDANPSWKDEAKGMQPDKLQEYMTGKLEQMLITAVGILLWWGDLGVGVVWGRELMCVLREDRVGRM